MTVHRQTDVTHPCVIASLLNLSQLGEGRLRSVTSTRRDVMVPSDKSTLRRTLAQQPFLFAKHKKSISLRTIEQNNLLRHTPFTPFTPFTGVNGNMNQN